MYIIRQALLSLSSLPNLNFQNIKIAVLGNFKSLINVSYYYPDYSQSTVWQLLNLSLQKIKNLNFEKLRNLFKVTIELCYRIQCSAIKSTDWLLFHRTRVQFPKSKWQLTTDLNSSSRGYDTLLSLCRH